MTVPSPVSSLLSVLLLFVKLVEGVEEPPWVDDAEDIFDSEIDGIIRTGEADDDDDSELNSKGDDTFSLSLSWAEGQTDGEGIFSLPLSEVFDRLSDAKTGIGVISPTDEEVMSSVSLCRCSSPTVEPVVLVWLLSCV